MTEYFTGYKDLRTRLGRLIERAGNAKRYIQQLPGGAAAVLSRNGKVDPVLNGVRILAADDKQSVRRRILDILTPCGCKVDLASDGSEATELLQRAHYDLVISDIKMPGATGYDVFRAVKSTCPDTEVILTTAFGYDEEHSVLRANQEGVFAVIIKPFKVSELLTQCRKALSAPSA